MKPTATVNGEAAATFAASRFVEDVEVVSLETLLRRRPVPTGKPRVVIARVDAGAGTDVSALRWLQPGGVAPLAVIPATFEQCVELTARAALHAKLAQSTVIVLIEHETAELEGMPVEPDTVKPGPLPPMPPLDPLLDELERDLRNQSHLSNCAPRLSRLDQDPAAGTRPEWMVVSYGTCVAPAAQAVAEARAKGQRVNHLALQTLWPVPEEAIQKAALGVKHIVMPERNLGQYIDEIRRILPMLTAIPANAVPGPVTAGQILDRLQNTPRCC